jgi:hypothetical protein
VLFTVITATSNLVVELGAIVALVGCLMNFDRTVVEESLNALIDLAQTNGMLNTITS